MTIEKSLDPFQSNGLDTRPWYRELWPWLLIGLIGFAVAASLGLVFVAVDSADDLVDDNYYKDGLAINRELAADDRARQLGISAQLDIDAQAQQLQLNLTGNLTLPTQVVVHFMHPFSANKDFTAILIAVSPGIYRAHFATVLEGRWTVEITGTTEQAWRVRQDIAVPAVSADAAAHAPMAFKLTP